MAALLQPVLFAAATDESAHRNKIIAMTPLRDGSEPRSVFWGPALQFLLRPLPHVMRRIDAFKAAQFPRGETVLAIHFRCVTVDGGCRYKSRNLLNMAVSCARKRLLALGANRLFVATMHHSHRLYFAKALEGVATVIWQGDAVEKQDQTVEQEESRLVDLMLLSQADELLIATHSTFGHMARALAHIRGTHATYFQDCTPVPPLATEATLHITTPVLANIPQCRSAFKAFNASAASDPATRALLMMRGLPSNQGLDKAGRPKMLG